VPDLAQLEAQTPCFTSPEVALAASATNQPRLRPLGSYSSAPVNCQRPSTQTSGQVWFPRSSCQRKTPAARAGMPMERQASTSKMVRPVHVARPCSMDSEAQAFGRLRPVL